MRRRVDWWLVGNRVLGALLGLISVYLLTSTRETLVGSGILVASAILCKK